MKAWLTVLTVFQAIMGLFLLMVLSDYRIGVSWELFREALASHTLDSIHLAAQIGRLDIVTLVLSLVGILLAFAFIGWMSLLRAEAKATVREVAENEAQSRLDKFISDEAASIIQGYLDLLNRGPSGDPDELARVSGAEEGKKKE